MAKVSILVAAYNVEAYIDEALHSAINQTLKDIEILVVDDGSTDKTAEIIKSYADKDKRVHLLSHEKNKGSMLARKTASQKATGKYILFLDGDDSLSFDACEKAYSAIEAENVDILQFKANIFGEVESPEKKAYHTANLNSYMASLEMKVISTSKAGLLGNRHSQNINFTIWNKLYKKEIVDKVSPHIPDMHLVIAEDVLFSYLACFHAKSYSCIDDALYNYRLGSGITTAETISDARIASLPKTFFVYTFLKKWTEEQQCSKICQKRLDILKQQALENICHALFSQVDKERRNQYISYVLQECSLTQLVAALSFKCSHSDPTKIGDYANILASLDIFKSIPKKKKTIGTFYYRLYNGGIEKVISKLTDIWINNGYDVVLFTNEPETKEDYCINPNVKRIVLPKYEENDLTSYEERSAFFSKKLKEHNVDIMVYHAWCCPHLLCDALIVKSLSIPLIVYTHGAFCFDLSSADIMCAYRNAEFYKIYSLADTIIALNKSDKAFWDAMGLRCIYTLNPLSIPLETDISPLDGKNILMTCRISPEKQVMDALKIVELVKKKIPDITLTVVGGGELTWYNKQLKEYVKQKKLDDTVHFTGFKTNVIPYYQTADLMLITSKFEGFCLSLIESKICGLPLVCYDMPNLDTIRNAEGIVVVPQNDIEDAAKNIIKILLDDSLKKNMGKQARKSAEKLYDLNFSTHWDTIFDETLKPHSPKAYTAEDAALQTLLYYSTVGIISRGVSNNTSIPAQDLAEYATHVQNLEATIREIRASTSYKLGWFLTWPFRKIKDKIKGQKYVK